MEDYIRLAEIKTCMASQKKEYQSVLVNKVDSFLYATDYILWRTCNGFELNGGFVSPNAAMVSARLPTPTTNVIRYDYRLRSGIRAYSVLKDFFEQEQE